MQVKPEQLSKIIIEETTRALEHERHLEQLAATGKLAAADEKPGFLKTAYGHFMKGMRGDAEPKAAPAEPAPEEAAPEEAPDVGGVGELEANLSALQSMVDEHEADYDAHEKKMTNMVDLIRRAVLDLAQGRAKAAKSKAATLKSGFAESKQKKEIKKLLKLFERKQNV
jgi:hypothetical protein